MTHLNIHIHFAFNNNKTYNKKGYIMKQFKQ